MRVSFVFLIPLLIYAQDLGTVSGTVLDAETGSGLPGVNIMLKGTYYGAATDMDGKFFIQNVSPGSYDVEVSMIAYKVILKTGVTILKSHNDCPFFQLCQKARYPNRLLSLSEKEL